MSSASPRRPEPVTKIKVVQVLPELNSGGVEKGTLELGKFLASLGHDSVVVSGGGRLVDQLETEGSRHVSWKLGRKSVFTLRHVRPFRRFLAKERPQILHLRSRAPAWIAWLAWRGMDPGLRPRLVTTVHGFNSVNRYSRIMTCGERVIAVSERMKEYLLQSYPDVSPERIKVIHRGIDPEFYPYGYRPGEKWLARWRDEYPELADRLILTLPGRITRLKGHEDLFHIIAGLRKRGMPAHALIVGGTDPRKVSYKKELDRIIGECGIGEYVTFTGNRSDLREIIAISDIVLSLSQKPESFGRTVLEGLSLGRPVVGYEHGGVGEQLLRLFPEGAVPVGNTDAVVRLIDSWKGNPPQPRPENPFTLQAMLNSTFALYEELLQPPK